MRYVEIEVDRRDLRTTRIVDSPRRALRDGEVRLRVEHFALTANNITYAVFGDAMQYWNFFPAAGDGWGRVPVWGFAEVAESAVDAVRPGRRVYGYLPMATELVVEAGRADERGFRDLAAHRQPMAAAYNGYLFTDADPVYDPAREPQHMVLWPLFFTSFVIDDFLADHDLYGAAQVILSSASAKTTIGAAFLLHERPDVDVVGLTSARNLEFVQHLGCYDTILTYGEEARLAARDSVFVDVAGDATVVAGVHGHLGERLRYSMIVGDTHWDAGAAPQPSTGPRREMLFAPTQIAKRTRDWGAGELDARVGGAWDRYSRWSDGWLRYEHHTGPGAVTRLYLDLVNGQVDPRAGHVASLA